MCNLANQCYNQQTGTLANLQINLYANLHKCNLAN
jgi:hypothetical protein